MAKRTTTAILPDGRKVSRTSDNKVYQFAVVAETSSGETRWVVLRWSQTVINANKAARTFAGYNIYDSVRVIPVEDTTKEEAPVAKVPSTTKFRVDLVAFQLEVGQDCEGGLTHARKLYQTKAAAIQGARRLEELVVGWWVVVDDETNMVVALP